MKKKYVMTLAASCLVALTSCSNLENDINGGKGTATVQIKLVSKSDTKAPTVTLPSTASEKAVNMLEFYVFESNGTTADVKVGAAPNLGYVKLTGTDLQNETHLLSVTAGTNKQILVAANMNLGPLTTTMNSFAAVKKALSSRALSTTNSRTIPVSGLEMSGVSVVNNVQPGYTTPVSIAMSRLVGKVIKPAKADAGFLVELKLNQDKADEIWGPGVDVTTANFDFTLDGYAVINGLSKSNVMFVGNASGDYSNPINVPWDLWDLTGKTPYVQSAFSGGNYTANYSGQQGTEYFLSMNKVEEPVFLYENKPVDKVDPVTGTEGYDPEQMPALIMKGTLKDNTSGKTAIRYWRVNLIKADSYHVMRNFAYKVIVKKISTPGYGTPEEAEDDQKVVPRVDDALIDFEIEVLDWALNEYETEM